MEFSGRAILLDIEGTTAPITYIYDVMFPFVRRRLDAWLAAKWDTVELNNTLEQMARDAGYPSWGTWVVNLDEAQQRTFAREQAVRLMDEDSKSTGLKALQGMIWEEGFTTGALKAEVYSDTVSALANWRYSGVKVCIYSSGSIQAQRLFFGHTTHGDLLALIDGHYDTTIGPKRAPASYRAIAQDMQVAANEILFLSDVVAELDAAAEADLQTALCIRPGNPASGAHKHPELTSFDEVKLVR